MNEILRLNDIGPVCLSTDEEHHVEKPFFVLPLPYKIHKLLVYHCKRYLQVGGVGQTIGLDCG